MTEDTKVEIEQLLTNIRGQFYGDLPEKKFFQDRNVLLLAITWPAGWLKERGITRSADRYFRGLRDILVGIKSHGATGKVKYFPGYLLKCVQDHFAHNSDTYCDEGKKALHSWERALGRAVGAAGGAQTRQAEQAIDVLAEAHRVLAVRRRPAKPAATPKAPDLQGSLF